MKTNSTVVAVLMFVMSLALYVGVINPISSSLLKTQAKLSDEKVRAATVEMSIGQAADMQKRIDELEATNAACRAAWMTPMLNSYAMRAKSLLDAMATEAGLVNVEYEEAPFRALPVPKEKLPDPERRTARRAVKVRALGDYAAAVSFLMRAEKELPTIALQAMSVKTQQTGTPERQEVEMVFEWPSEGEVIP